MISSEVLEDRKYCLFYIENNVVVYEWTLNPNNYYDIVIEIGCAMVDFASIVF